MEDSELKRLIERLKARDERALELLMDAYGPKLLDYLRKFFSDRRDAEEVWNDVWFEVWTTVHQYDGRMSFKSWLYKKAKWRMTDRLRQQKEEIVPLDLDTAVAGGQARTRSTSGSDARERQLRVVYRALAELPPEDRFLVEAYIAGIRSSEIAARLGVKPSTVRMKFKRIIARLRKDLLQTSEILAEENQAQHRL